MSWMSWVGFIKFWHGSINLSLTRTILPELDWSVGNGYAQSSW